jgi:hypothetical protein
MQPTSSLPNNGAVPAETFLTEKEAVNVLKVSVRTLQRWRVEGCGPRFRRHGRSVRYAMSDILAWSEASSATSTSTSTSQSA